MSQLPSPASAAWLHRTCIGLRRRRGLRRTASRATWYTCGSSSRRRQRAEHEQDGRCPLLHRAPEAACPTTSGRPPYVVCWCVPRVMGPVWASTFPLALMVNVKTTLRRGQKQKAHVPRLCRHRAAAAGAQGPSSRARPCTTKPRARTPTGLLRQRLVCGDKFVRSFERAKTGTNRHVRSPSAACGRAVIPAGSEHRRAPARVPARARAETAVTGASASHVLGLEARSTRAASG
jgi:hypothetical protein